MKPSRWRLALTEQDNETPDFIRIGGAIAVLSAAMTILVYLALYIIAFFTSLTFDPMPYAGGVGTLLASLGAFLVLMGAAHRAKPADPPADTPDQESK